GPLPGEEGDAVAPRQPTRVVGHVEVAEDALGQLLRGAPDLLQADDVGVALGEPGLEAPSLRRPDAVDVEAGDPQGHSACMSSGVGFATTSSYSGCLPSHFLT